MLGVRDVGGGSHGRATAEEFELASSSAEGLVPLLHSLGTDKHRVWVYCVQMPQEQPTLQNPRSPQMARSAAPEEISFLIHVTSVSTT